MHKGFAFIDVISPCVAFNKHNGSTKSYDYVRGRSERLVAADYIAAGEEISVDYESGALEDVAMPDGSTLRLRKLDEDYDPRDRIQALTQVQRSAQAGEVVTGLLYVDADAADCHDVLGTPTVPLNALDESVLCPGAAALEGVNAQLR